MLPEIRARLAARQHLEAEQLQFLQDALSRFLSGADLAKALGLKGTRRGTMPPRTMAGAPLYSKDGKISEGGIGSVYMELRNGEPHPTDARATLRTIHDSLATGPGLTKNMRLYIRHALDRYLDGVTRGCEKPALPMADGPFCAIPVQATGAARRRLTAEQAFGLKRSRMGKAGPPLEMRQEIAGYVLDACLQGALLKDAASAVGANYNLGRHQILDIWKHHKIKAIEIAKQLRIAGDPNLKHRNYPWRDKEKRILQRLFARDNADLARVGLIAEYYQEDGELKSRLIDAPPKRLRK